MGRHLPHGLRQELPATWYKYTCPALTPACKLVLDLPSQKDGRLSWPRVFRNEPAGNWICNHKSDALTSKPPSRDVGCMFRCAVWKQAKQTRCNTKYNSYCTLKDERRHKFVDSTCKPLNTQPSFEHYETAVKCLVFSVWWRKWNIIYTS